MNKMNKLNNWNEQIKQPKWTKLNNWIEQIKQPKWANQTT